MRLTYSEAEAITADLDRVWHGMTIVETPTHEALTDIVQRVMRKAREIAAAREGEA